MKALLYGVMEWSGLYYKRKHNKTENITNQLKNYYNNMNPTTKKIAKKLFSEKKLDLSTEKVELSLVSDLSRSLNDLKGTLSIMQRNDDFLLRQFKEAESLEGQIDNAYVDINRLTERISRTETNLAEKKDEVKSLSKALEIFKDDVENFQENANELEDKQEEVLQVLNKVWRESKIRIEQATEDKQDVEAFMDAIEKASEDLGVDPSSMGDYNKAGQVISQIDKQISSLRQTMKQVSKQI